MAIEKNSVKSSAGVSRFDSEFSMGSRSRESMTSDDDELHKRKCGDSEEEDEFDDADSGAGSDDFDLLELGETGSEFCQVGDQTCCIPFELYDLTDLHGILSLDVWSECLTEEERFGLTKYLPDMDQETFMVTLKELFEGANFHFGSPITKLYEMLKGGLCEPRVALYRQGLNFFQRHQHYHLLHKRQDSMVSNLLQIREAWQNCKGYSIEEKTRVLNIVRSQKSLMAERNEDTGTDSSEREESGEALWSKRSRGRNAGQKESHVPAYGRSPALDVLSRERSVDPKKQGKQNPKGLLKVVGSKTPPQNEIASHIVSRHHGYQKMKSGASCSDLILPRGGKAAIYDAMTAQQLTEQMASDDEEREELYGVASRRDRNAAHGNLMDRGRSGKSGKKREVFRGDEYDGDSYSAKNDFLGHRRNLNINQLSDISILTAKPSKMRDFYNPAKKAKYVEPAYEDQVRSIKGRSSKTDFVDVPEPYWSKKTQRESHFTDPSFDYEDMDVRSRRLNSGRDLPDSRLKSQEALQHHMNDGVYHREKRVKHLHEKIRGTSIQNGGSGMLPAKGGRMFHGGEETESDSSDQLEDEEDDSPLIRIKLAVDGRLDNSRSSLSRSVFDPKGRRTNKDVKESALVLDGMLSTSSTVGNFGRHVQRPEIDMYSSRNRQKAKMQHPDLLRNLTLGVQDEGYNDGLAKSNIERNRKSTYKVGRNGQVQAELAGSFPMSLNKASLVEGRKKGTIGHDFSSHHLQGYSMEEDESLVETDRMGARAQNLDTTLIGCSSSVKKQKGKEGSTEIDAQEGTDFLHCHQLLDESISLKKRVKKRPEPGRGSLEASLSELPIAEPEKADLDLELKPQKFTLITPTIHTGFSFSIVHLLSAVRMALITPNPENSLEVGNHHENTGARPEDQNAKHDHINGSLGQRDVKNPGLEQINVLSLTVQEIVNRVRFNPGDPCILETQEPLQDLVRGVLKIFSSKTAPLGAKCWKPLVLYEKSTKSWSWIGQIAHISLDYETLDEVTSPDAWGIPHKMLVKLVDSFASWLKSGQETLKQIGSLPAPPLELMQHNFDEKERFRDLRAQKSLTTISPSCDEVRAYFRKEEQLRYSVPDRAFSYTAADGKKSIVAPLRRCGGKPTSKARDHFMLKRDRPPHVTILCLVRDAAARLPGSIGTRADVCTLIRDSQYIVEDVTDAQVNQVVSGALDRLHYERDPCVQFDGERKLWVYLHREREEEDFEDDCTSSTKKWKRQKKDVPEPDDQVTIACPGGGEQSGFDLSSDLNVNPTSTNSDKVEAIYDDSRQRTNDVKASHMPAQSAFQKPLESNLRCQENSANEDFGDDT